MDKRNTTASAQGEMMKRILPAGIAVLITVLVFWKFFVYGSIPAPFNFMAAWYEPWKTEYSVNGVPTILHKAVGDDIFRQIYPLRDLATDLLRQGVLPLWNPYNGAGQPLLATLHTGVSNPFSVLPWAWFVVFQAPLLFLSMYWFLRTRSVSVFGAAVGATSLCLSGVAVARYPYGDYMYAMAGLPILLVLIERRRYIWIPVVSGFVLVSVQPQISVYVLLAGLLYGWVRKKKDRLLLLAVLLAGAGLAAFQLFPTFELYARANVTSGSSSFIFGKFLMPVSHLLTVIIPNYFGNQGTYNFWGKTDYVETVAGIGMIPVFLALLGARGHRLWAWASAATMLLTLDWFLPRLVYSMPVPVLSTSIPTRIYMLAAFGIAVLAGFGTDRTPRKTAALAVFAAGILAVGLSGTFICPSEITDCTRVALRNSVFEIVVFFAGALLLFSRTFRYGVLIVLIAAGVYNAWKFLPFSQPEYVEAPHPVLSMLAEVAPSRVTGVGGGAFATDFATQYRYFDTNYYDPLYIRRYGELVSYVNTGDRDKGLIRSDVNIISDATVSAEMAQRRERFLDMTGTVALVTKKSETAPLCRPGDPLSSRACDSMWEDEHWRIEKREAALPRAYLVGDVRVQSDSDKLLDQLFSADTNPAQTAFTEASVSGIGRLGNATGSAVITSYKPGSISLTVRSGAQALLVLSDTWYPGWKADVDGVEVPVYRTNYAFRGVVVPEGMHTVRFWYDPDSFRYGSIISLLSLAGVAGRGLRMRRKGGIT